MASEKNLNAVFTDIANAIRGKKGTTDQIKPINMADEIVNLPSGGSFPPDWTEIGYTETPQYIIDGFEYAKKIASEWDETKTSASSKYQNDNKLIFFPYVNTSNVTDMNDMFMFCSLLISIPQIDTSNVTKMTSMFYGCNNLTSIPKFNTHNVTRMDTMFSNCSSLISIPQIDTSNVTDMHSVFSGCSKLVDVPQIDTSSVTDMSYMFNYCSLLTTIPKIDASSANSLNGIFQNCSSLKSILMYGMKVSFSISHSTKFEESDLVTILNNLATVTSTQTLTMGSTNLAKLTDEEKAIATNKGWTLA